MSFLDNLFGSEDDKNTALPEKDIAMDMAEYSKFRLVSLAAAAAEAVNQELRTMLMSQLDTAVKEHFELSDLLIKKGWYPAFENPKDQLKMSYEDSQSLNQES
jgi:similar to spore coat protein